MNARSAKNGVGGADNRPSGPRCPICNEAAQSEYRPFCSRRCADVDLGRWMTGAYALPAEEEDDPDAQDHAQAQRPDAPGEE